jgi:hypothetical protein
MCRPLGRVQSVSKLAHGIRQQRDFTHGIGDGFEALRIEREAVDHGLAEAVLLRTGEIEGVRGEDGVLPRHDLIGHGDAGWRFSGR